MSMIFCPKCGKQISDKAPVCPHCKSPNPFMQNQQPQMQPQFQQAPTVQNQPASKHSKLVPVLLILILVIGIATATPYLIRKNKSSDSSTAETQTFTNDNPLNNAIVPKEDATKFTFTETETNAPVKPTEATAKSEKCMVKFKFSVEDQVNPFRVYDTDVLIDGKIICTLGDGEVKNDIPELSIERGIHTIRFQKNGDPTFYKELTEVVNDDCTLSYHIFKLAGAGSETFRITKT